MTVIVEAGPFNGPDDADSVMNWVDITGYVNDNLQPPTTAVGRQTELDQVNPGPMTLVLNNADHRFTPGNTSSPYYPGWRPSMRLRMRETIGYQSFTHFDGNMLQPELTIQTPGIDQTAPVNAIDRLGRLQQSRKFISTLAEWIIYNGGTTLKAYYPLGETKSPWRDAVGGQPALAAYLSTTADSPTIPDPYSYTPGGGTQLPGDDLRGVLFHPSTKPNGAYNQFVTGWGALTNYKASSAQITAAGTDPITFVAWVNLDSTYFDTQEVLALNVVDAAADVVALRLNRLSFNSVTPGVWDGSMFDGLAGYTGEVVGNIDPGGKQSLVGMQWTYSPASLKLWIDGVEFTATPTGPLTPPFTFRSLLGFGPLYSGSIAHFQLYVGNYSRTQFLAQRDAGFTGLAGQYTGQRITTVAQYAGMSAGDMAIDAGTSRMQKATLAGRSPLDVMQEAATTEQGLLHAAGRRLLFHDRLRRYNR